MGGERLLVDGSVLIGRVCIRKGIIRPGRVWGSSRGPIIRWIASIGRRTCRFLDPFSG